MTKNEKISLKLKELWQNSDWRNKMIKFRKGRVPWNKGLKTGLVPKSAFKKGYKQTQEMKDKRNTSRKGYRHSEETKIKISKANLGKEVLSGDKHYKWNGGKRYRNKHSLYNLEYRFWRLEVFKRDNFKCKIENENCNRGIQAHHILSWSKFPELRYEINNGITLCQYHHPLKNAEVEALAPVFQKMVQSALAN